MNFSERLLTTVICLALLFFISLSVAIPYDINLSSKGKYDTKAKILLQNHPLIDGHNDWSDWLNDNMNNQVIKHKDDLYDLISFRSKNELKLSYSHTDLNRLQESRLGAQFWSIYTPCATQYKDSIRANLERLDAMKRLIKMFPDYFQYASNSEDIKKAFETNRIASLFGLEGGHGIDSSLAVLRQYYELGIRYMTLTHNCNTPWVDNHLVDSNNTFPRNEGLTDFGKLVIKEMNRLGMLIDISHTSYKTQLDVLELSKTPVIFSHSNVYNLCNHTRNVKDSVLLKLKENKGIIMISFYNYFVTCSNTSTLKDVKDHLNYIRNLIGPDYIGIGSDYDGVAEVPIGLEDVTKFPKLFSSLLEDGWTELDLIKLAGSNILRVLEENEKVRFASSNFENTFPFEDAIEIKSDDFADCKTLH